VVAEKSRGHLDAPVTGDAVKVVLVTLIATANAPLEPEARLDCAMGHQVISLPFKPLCDLVGEVLHNAESERDEQLYSYSRDLRRKFKRKSFL